MIQKVYGGEKPVPLWLEDSEETSTVNRLLFSLIIKIQRIQLTATTAGSSAVRLETGELYFYFYFWTDHQKLYRFGFGSLFDFS